MASMSLFAVIFNRLVPLYLLVLAGFVAGRYFKVNRETVASILIYFLTPAVILNAILSAELRPRDLLLPLVFFILCSGVCLTVYLSSRRLPTRNLAAFASGDGNTGYFGIPVAAAILGEDALGFMVLAGFGFILYENTLGFFITARGNYSIQQSAAKVLKLPAIYAFMLALAGNALDIKVGGVFADLFRNIRGAYSVLGMMLIGIGVAGLTRFRIDWKLNSVVFAAKFLLWPLIVGALIWVDSTYLGIFSTQIHQVMLVISTVPLAANTVAIAALLNVEPEKAAVSVLLSTVFALFFIPWVVANFL